MALSGSFTGSILAGKYTLRVSWSATQNIAENTSRILCDMYLVQASGWSLGIASRSDNSTTIAGTTYTWASPAISNSGGKTTKLATVSSGNITHNADGTKSVTISATFNIRATISGTYYSTITASQTVTLDTIPRATQPTVSASSVDMGTAVTIGTPRASGNFTHDLAYAFAGGSYVSIAAGVGTSYGWTVPDLASQIPNATNGTVTIRCITKNGGTTIGTKYVLLTAKVPASVVPTVSAVTLTEQTAGLATQFGAFIQGKSTIKAAVSASGAKGSTIKSYSTTFEGRTYTAQTFTTPSVQGSGSLTMTTTVTDSRGRTATKATTVSVLAYTLPTISAFRALRVNADGDADPNGTTVSVSYHYAVAALGNKNTASMKIEYKRSTLTTWTATGTASTALSGGAQVSLSPTFSTDYQFDLRITVTDWFGASSTYTAVVPSGAVILDIRANGQGVSFGRVSERDGLDSAWLMYDRFLTLINNGLAVYTGSGSTDAVDPDTTLESLVLTDKKAPASIAGFWFISTSFYSAKSATANRVQYAMPYNSSASHFTRHYYEGAWSAWREIVVVVESGTSGIWRYKKYSDGTAECFGRVTLTTDIAGSWGSLYTSGALTPTNVSFPFTFADIPTVNATLSGNSAGGILMVTGSQAGGTTTEKTGYYEIARGATLTGGSFIINYQVTGRWK